MSFKAKLILSYIVIISASFGVVSFFLEAKILAIGFFFAAALSFVAGSVIARSVTVPINDMIGLFREYSDGDFTRRASHISGDEFGSLAKTLNKMAGDIDDKMSRITTQNQRLTAIFDNMIEGVAVIDVSGHILSANNTMKRIFGFQEVQAGKALFLEVIRNNEIWDVISTVLKAGEPVSKEINIIYPVRKIFRVNATPISESHTVEGCLIVLHDVTEMKALETMRSDFVANVSHELKTPLTSIKGFVETLMDGALDDKEHGRGFLKIIQDHANRLDSLVSDILALAHLESREMALDKKDFSPKVEADRIISGFAAQAGRSGIKIKNELPAGLSVNADKKRIDQVLTNLIDNAVRFNRSNGEIRLFSQDASGATKFIVEDSGSGIPERDISRIFERFYRVDKARSHESGGTGLGLSIVKHIVELHDGKVGVESVEGLGSKFWFTIPK
ncbi:MAG: PAS domain S-box protein [Candidatus Omnitrophica bacterium]|nr:PAS domain S-box protein [Candidatus Omnitrophota bacterium]